MKIYDMGILFQTFTPKKVQVSGAVRGIYLVPHRIPET